MSIDHRPLTADQQSLSATAPRQPSLSVAIIAKDEERHIGAALASVIDLADEIVVVLDQRTHDRTASICRSYGVWLFVEPWRGFSAQRNLALGLCSGEWVLFLDGDERIPAELAHEVRKVTGIRCQVSGDASTPDTRYPIHDMDAGYWIARDNYFFGKIVRGGGWSPDYQLRLLRRGRAHYDEARTVHELPILDGEAGHLQARLLHLNIERFDELYLKQRSYAIQEAHTLYHQGQRARWRNFLGAPVREFRRRYIQLGGYRDGQLGLLLCATLAYFELVKYMHLMALTLLRPKRQPKKI